MYIYFYYCRADNIEWNPESNPPVKVIPFKEYPQPYGPSFLAPSSLLQLFHVFFTTELLSSITTETNLYAEICLKEAYETWDKVTVEELQAYLGFMMLMGIVQLPSIRDYWSNSDTFHYKPIASRISRTRFLQIHRFLHFVNNENLPAYGEPTYSKIQKVKPILLSLSNKCMENFIPGRDVAIDEAMVKYKGRSSLKQYMPKKPIKRGFKIWMRADSKTGYVSQFCVYEGKTKNMVEKGLGANVVMNLIDSIHGHYHHVYFDNFFTSVDLLLNLLRRGTYGCGTMRQDRKGFPTHLKPFIKKGLPARGDHKVSRNGNMSVVVWQDTKPISCASTNSKPEETKDIKRRLKDGTTMTIKCPDSIVSYNSNMGGVDRNDQLRGYYNIPLKSRKYYKYLFFAAVDIVVTNMFVTSKFFPELTRPNLKIFRADLAMALIGGYNSRKKRGRPSSQQPNKKFCTSHFPTRAEKKGYRCFFCHNYLQRRRETIWYCKDCQKHLCHTGKEDDCFHVYHTQYGPDASEVTLTL